MTKLGSRIREARKAAGISQETLGEKLGVHRNTTNRWEREGGTAPTPAQLRAIARETGVSVEWLLEEDEEAAAHLWLAEELARCGDLIGQLAVALRESKAKADALPARKEVLA